MFRAARIGFLPITELRVISHMGDVLVAIDAELTYGPRHALKIEA